MSENQNFEIVEVKQAEMLEAINRSEVDMQIATAKQFPRNITEALNKIATYATLDQETAEDCFYVLRRGGSVIEGVSVRLAEIIALSWGNLRVATRLVGNDGQKITVQAVCHDLETNYAVCKEVQRRITDKQGRTFSQDMQVVTANAAAAIAYRNAVLTVIPKAVTKKVIDEVKNVALGQAIDLEQSRQNSIAYFAKLGVTQEQILQYLEVKSIDEIDKQKIFELRATANAIKEGTTTVQETFVKPMEDAKRDAKAKREASEAKKRTANAIAKAMGGQIIDKEETTVKTQENAVSEDVTEKAPEQDNKPNEVVIPANDIEFTDDDNGTMILNL